MPAPAALTTDDGALDWVHDLLAPHEPPEPAVPAIPPAPPGRWVVLPSSRRPRLFVPRGAPRAAGAALAHDTGLGGAKRRLAAIAFRRGVVPPGLGGRLDVPAGTGLAAQLASLAGSDPAGVVVAVAIGPPRPNRKAVVQLLGLDGTSRAWAKVACSPLTERLVGNEAHWLGLVAGVEGIEAPTVLARDTYLEHRVLATEPLPDRARTAPFAVTPELIERIAALAPGPAGKVADSAWWHATAARVADLGDIAATTILTHLERQLGHVHWRFGAWHGDLTRWNARIAGDVVQVWDWERADGDRPLGFDAAHAAFQDAQVAGGFDVAAAATATDAALAGLLPTLELDPAAAPHLVTAYLLERRLRWAEDAQLGSTTATTTRHDAMLATMADRLGTR